MVRSFGSLLQDGRQIVVLLPNAERAIVDEAKVRDYLLSPSHPVGRFKAAFFWALGFSADDWRSLSEALLTIGRSGEVNEGQASPFGQKFEIRASLTGPSGRQATIVTVWMVSNGRDFAHFVTAFPS
jgi:hypothetical protein